MKHYKRSVGRAQGNWSDYLHEMAGRIMRREAEYRIK